MREAALTYADSTQGCPLSLISQYGAFLNSNVVDDFNNYASNVFQRYGKKVKIWLTFNEPQVSDSLFDLCFIDLRLSVYRSTDFLYGMYLIPYHEFAYILSNYIGIPVHLTVRGWG